MKKKKVLFSVLAAIIIAAISIGGYLFQKDYYKKKAIENTRFITKLNSMKPPQLNYKSFNEVLNGILEDPSWIQSYINGDKYVVACNGLFNGKIINVEFYVHEKNGKMYIKDSKTFVVFKQNGKIINDGFAFGVLFLNYGIKYNLDLPEAFKTFQSEIDKMETKVKYDPLNLDEKVYDEYTDKYAEKLANEEQQKRIEQEQEQEQERSREKLQEEQDNYNYGNSQEYYNSTD